MKIAWAMILFAVASLGVANPIHRAPIDSARSGASSRDGSHMEQASIPLSSTIERDPKPSGLDASKRIAFALSKLADPTVPVQAPSPADPERALKMRSATMGRLPLDEFLATWGRALVGLFFLAWARWLGRKSALAAAHALGLSFFAIYFSSFMSIDWNQVEIDMI